MYCAPPPRQALPTTRIHPNSSWSTLIRKFWKIIVIVLWRNCDLCSVIGTPKRGRGLYRNVSLGITKRICPDKALREAAPRIGTFFVHILIWFWYHSKKELLHIPVAMNWVLIIRGQSIVIRWYHRLLWLHLYLEHSRRNLEIECPYWTEKYKLWKFVSKRWRKSKIPKIVPNRIFLVP